MTRPIQKRAPLWLDFWATAQSATFRKFIADIQEAVAANEERTRKRKPKDMHTFSRCVEVIVANLASSALTGVGSQPTGDAQPIGVPLKKDHPNWRQGRYSHHGLKHETFRKLLDAMDGEFLSFERSTWRGISSSICPSQAFVEALASYGVTASDIGRAAECEETIQLIFKRGKNDRAYINYSDTPETIAMRVEVAAINRHLETARLSFVPCDNFPLTPVCLSQRRLSRRFILPSAEHPNSFAYGGRLYGGFWETLSRERRRASLRIDGERIAEADLNALFLRLASAMGGVELDYDSDPYDALLYSLAGVPAFDGQAMLGLQGYRSGLKGAIAALLFKPDLKRWPEETRNALPQGLTVKQLRFALLQAFPGLTRYLREGALLASCASSGVPIGYTLFRIESDILVAALRLLREAGVTALPLHDAVLVAERAAGFAKECLERSARDVAGAACERSVRIPAKVWKASSE